MLLLQSQKLCSQTVLKEDSLCFSLSESKIILKDLARLDYLDSTIVRKDSIIYNYVRLDSVRVDRINDYVIHNTELINENKKLLKRSKRNLRLGSLFGLIAGLFTQLLF